MTEQAQRLLKMFNLAHDPAFLIRVEDDTSVGFSFPSAADIAENGVLLCVMWQDENFQIFEFDFTAEAFEQAVIEGEKVSMKAVCGETVQFVFSRVVAMDLNEAISKVVLDEVRAPESPAEDTTSGTDARSAGESN